MSMIWVMIIVASAGGTQGGIAIEKAGIYQSEKDCLAAGFAAGFTRQFGEGREPGFYCLPSSGDMGFE